MVDVLVKGGTTSLAWDQEKARQRASADARRQLQDRQQAAAEAQGARLYSHKLFDKQVGRTVLEYRMGRTRDSILKLYCIAEVFLLPLETGFEYAFTMECPKCIGRGSHPEDAIMLVRQSNRDFVFDMTPADKGGKRFAAWLDPDTGESVILAGSITTKDRIRCAALGCEWSVRIDDNVVVEA